MLQEAITSVLNQDFNFPYLLWIYDNSTDLEVKNYLKSLQSDKIRVSFIPHKAGENQYFLSLNDFIDKVEAEYIFNMQDDDLLEPNYLKEMVNKFEQGHGAVYSGMKYLRKNGSVEIYNDNLIYPNQVKPIASNLELFQLAARKEVFLKVGYPYIKVTPYNIAGMLEGVYDFVSKVAKVTEVQPVGLPLYIHRWTETSTWTSY